MAANDSLGMTTAHRPLRVLVLGGYGLIGLAIVRALHAAGHEVTGLGRSAEQGRRLFPQATWRAADIAGLQHAAAWRPLLDGVEVVVNAAGALQDGGRDNLAAVHDAGIAAMVSACEAARVSRIVQISAVGASADASTEFMRSKARGDAAVRAGTTDWVILRPGLVLSPNAYGGSALIRMLAAFPLVSPIAMPDARVQTVAISDVCAVVGEAVTGRLATGSEFDLVEAGSHSLREVVDHFRRWLGFPPARLSIALPGWCLAPGALFADALGYLGWRSPLRSNALRALRDGIIGDATALRRQTGSNLQSLEQTLDAMPATLQERWFARLFLLQPLMVAILSLFWLLSGFIALANVERAAAVLSAQVITPAAAKLLVVGGAWVDILLGATVLVGPLARRACAGMVAVSLAYLVAGSVLTPALWSDPLGPLLKVLPAIILALVTMAVLEER